MITAYFRCLIERADTPARRCGVLLILVSVLSLLFSVFHWHVNNPPFLYFDTVRIFDDTRPSNEGNNYYVSSSLSEWGLVDRNCLEKQNYDTKNEYAKFFAEEKCITRRIERKAKFKEKLTSSFPDYAVCLFTTFWGIAIISIMIGGILLYIGLIQKTLLWIKQGKQ